MSRFQPTNFWVSIPLIASDIAAFAARPSRRHLERDALITRPWQENLRGGKSNRSGDTTHSSETGWRAAPQLGHGTTWTTFQICVPKTALDSFWGYYEASSPYLRSSFRPLRQTEEKLPLCREYLLHSKCDTNYVIRCAPLVWKLVITFSPVFRQLTWKRPTFQLIAFIRYYKRMSYSPW